MEKDGNKHTLLPLKAEDNKEALGNSVTLMNEKTLLQEDEKGKEMHFASVGKPKVILTSTNLEDLPEEIQNFLNDCADIVVDELLPIRSISEHNDLISGISLSNKVAYRITHENVEAGTQVEESMDKWLISESLNPCAVPIALSPKNEDLKEYAVSKEELKLDPKKIQADENWLTPRSIFEGDVKSRWRECSSKDKQRADMRRRKKKFQAGDLVMYCRKVPILKVRRRTTKRRHNRRKSKAGKREKKALKRTRSQTHYQCLTKWKEEPVGDVSRALENGDQFQTTTRSVFFPGSLMQEHRDGPAMWEIAHMLWLDKLDFICC